MPVDSQHPDYTRKIARWLKNRDAYEGEDAVKADGKNYLVPAGGLEDADSRRYRMRAKWYGATSRTVQGLSGTIFQKDPVVECSTAVKPHQENITLTGISSTLFADGVLSEVQLMGRYGILLDYDEEMRRPYWSGIPVESIINWHVTYTGGNPKLSLLVIKECIDRLKDDYEIERVDRYRVCHINADGFYEVFVFEQDTLLQNRGFIQTEAYVPTRYDRRLDFIPFQFFGVKDLTPNVGMGPLDALIDINYAYFRHSADYEQALFLTGMPKYVVTGQSLDEGVALPVGSLSAWVFGNPDVKATILEYQGHGLQSHERAMNNDKVEMATLGARLLEEEPDTQETLGAVQIRHSGETGSLKSVANLVSEGLTRVLRWHHWWNGDTENLNDERFSFTLNTDFSTVRLDPQELQALMALWQGGGISKETLFWNLKQGEIVPGDREFKDEEKLIDDAAPARIPLGDVPDDDEPEDDEEDEDETSEEEAA